MIEICGNSRKKKEPNSEFQRYHAKFKVNVLVVLALIAFFNDKAPSIKYLFTDKNIHTKCVTRFQLITGIY